MLIVSDVRTDHRAYLLYSWMRGRWSEQEIAYVLQQVLRALSYVHAQQRVHRDVKAANVLLSATGAVKVSDFGVSGQMTGAITS